MFTYKLKWSKTGVYYFGARTRKGSVPSDLWTVYFTSSKYVKEYVKLHGDPDVIRVTRTFSSPEECFAWERRLLTRVNAKRNPLMLNRSNGFGDTHNYKDGFQTPETQTKVSNTLLIKYGGRASGSSIIKNKVFETNLAKYGEISTLNTPKVKEARQAANIKKWGTANPFSSRKWIESRTNPMHVEKHRAHHKEVMTNKDWTDRNNVTAELMYEKYGVQYYYQSDEFKSKYKATMLEKYGVDHYSKTTEYKEKMLKHHKPCPFRCKDGKSFDKGNFTIHMTRKHNWSKEQVQDYYANQSN